MTGNIALDVAIGLVIIYLLYSLLATIIQEFIATFFSFRAKILKLAIFRMLEDDDKFHYRTASILYLFKKTRNCSDPLIPSDQFFSHPLIKYLAEDKFRSKPAYINNSTFSKVITDLLRGEHAKPGDDISSLIKNALEEKKLKWGNIPIAQQTLTYLNSIWTDTHGDVDKFRELLENWFDETMKRVSGWYKRYTEFILFIVALIIAISFNVDTIKIVNKLEKDPKLREQLVQQADAFVKAHPNLDLELKKEKIENENFIFYDAHDNITPIDTLQKRKEIAKYDSISEANFKKLKQNRDTLLFRANSLINGDINKVNGLMGLGLESYDCKCGQGKFFLTTLKCFFTSLAGWLITALAISLGAPFWFDLLNKLMSLRSSVPSATVAQISSKKESTDKNEKPAVG